MRPILIVVSAPILHLFTRIGKRQKPVLVQTLGPKAAVERFDIRIVGGLAGPREVQRDTPGIRSQIQVTADELRALVDPDRRRMAGLSTGPLQHLHPVLTPVAEARIDDR